MRSFQPKDAGVRLLARDHGLGPGGIGDVERREAAVTAMCGGDDLRLRLSR